MCAPPSFAKENGNGRSALSVIAGALGIVVIGCLLWIPSTGENPSPQPETPIGIPIGSVVAPAASMEPEISTRPPLATTVDTPEPSPREDDSVDPLVTPPTLVLQSGKLTWEAQIEAMLASQLSDTVKASQLLSQLSVMPAEAYSRLAQEAVERLPDRDYAAVALPVLLNPSTNGSAEAVLYVDLLERPDQITLPALLALARNPRHSFAGTARETLSLLVGTDFGTDWQRWESAIAGLLADSQ